MNLHDFCFLGILHYLGRSVGLDCDCNEIDWCDMVATAVGMILTFHFFFSFYIIK